MKKLLFLLPLLLIYWSCGASPVDSAQACEDLARKVGELTVRCKQGTSQEGYDSFIKAAACGSCSNIIQMRDRNSFYDTCIPLFENVACDRAENAANDPSCKGQLLRKSDAFCF